MRHETHREEKKFNSTGMCLIQLLDLLHLFPHFTIKLLLEKEECKNLYS